MKKGERFLGALTAGFIAFQLSCGESVKPPLKTIPTPLKSEQPLKTNAQIIQEAIIALGIQKDEEEIRMWETEGFKSLPINALNDDEIINESGRRLEIALDLMKKSHNPYFQKTAGFLEPLLDSQEIGFIMSFSKKKTFEPFESTVYVENGNFHFAVIVPVENLENMDALGVAFNLVHSVRHIQNWYLDLEELPSDSSTSQKLKKLQDRGDTDSCVIDEKTAYAQEALAYIFESGLLGHPPTAGDGKDEMAAAWIKGGNNSDSLNSQPWHDYIMRKAQNCFPLPAPPTPTKTKTF